MNHDHETLETSTLSLRLNPRGIVFDSLLVRPDASNSRDVLVGFENSEDLRQRTFFGPVVGRYANRLPAGKTQLCTGATISLTGTNSVCLHGGDAGFDTLPWTPIPRPDSALFPLDDPAHPPPPLPSDPHQPPSQQDATFRLYSPAGADGFPCTLETEVLIVVTTPTARGESDLEEGDRASEDKESCGKVKVVMRSKIKEDGDKDVEMGTPVNLTVHWGFRLDDCKNPNVLGHKLFIDSTELVSLDEKGLSTGSIDKIESNGKGYDFASSGLEGQHREIGQGYPDEGIDRNFLLRPQRVDSRLPISSNPQVVLTSPSGDSPSLSLSFRTSLPSVQVYSAPGLDGTGPTRKLAHVHALSSADPSKGYQKDGAIFLEFQQPVGTIVHTATEEVRRQGNELKTWLEERTDQLGMGDDAREGGLRSWERDSLLRKGQVWESVVEMDVRVAK
ncbi:hypothetical protein JCM10212_004151 [Sporobolomyces blumeae]